MQLVARCFAALMLLALASPAVAQDSSDVFHDLVRIKRAPETGQPILQKRLIDIAGTPTWSYCAIPIDASGAEIPFADGSCAVEASQQARLVRVSEFGRVSALRVSERTLRVHFDEIVADIQAAEAVDIEPGGRLRLGSDCSSGACASWKVLDAPGDNLALYHRLMKYGHLQTDPGELDPYAEPAGTAVHVALRPEDWPKFQGALAALLPREAASDCFAGAFSSDCARPQSLTAEDFVRAAAFLTAAADPHATMTIDGIQFLNRLLKIAQATPDAAAAVDTLPVLIRDDEGVISPAPFGLPAPADERVVDFARAAYLRTTVFAPSIRGLNSSSPGYWFEDGSLPFAGFLQWANGTAPLSVGVNAFAANGADNLRAIELVDNSRVPLDLYALHPPPTVATVTTVLPVTVETDPLNQPVTLSARITSDGMPVTGGTVVFSVYSSTGGMLDPLAIARSVVDGLATTTWPMRGNLPPQTMRIVADYHGAPGFAKSTGEGQLTIVPAVPPEISVRNAVAGENDLGWHRPLLFELTLSKRSTHDVTVQYTTRDLTAHASSDYIPSSGTITFSRATSTFDPGVRSVWVTVSVLDDTIDEPEETLYLELSSPVGATLARARAVGTIVDNDGDALKPPLDINQDGSADIVFRHAGDGRIGVWYLDGLTQLVSTVTDPAANTDLNWEIRAVGDFNSDWKPDIVWQHRTTGELAVWFMDANRCIGTSYLTTLAGTAAEASSGWKIMAAADMDGDGMLDLVWQNETSGELRIWHMAGTEQLDSTSIALGVAGSDWRIAGVADLNGDGWNDVVWRSQSQNAIATWLMQDGRVLDTRWLTPAIALDETWQVVGVRDIDRDGRADLVWQKTDGSLAVWLMDRLVLREAVTLTGVAAVDPNWKVVAVR